MSNDEFIHDMYTKLQNERTFLQRARLQQVADSNKLNTYFGRQPFVSASPRTNEPSFRSLFFNVGEGLLSIQPQETAIVAQKTVPSQHGGVLTGFSQYFGDCDADLQNLVLWGLRINGLVPQGFMDFVGDYSSLAQPHQVYFPLAGGAATLGSVDASIGSTTIEDIPTVIFQATNYYTQPIVLQGRLEGYTFPTAERDDEFSNI